MFSSFRFNQRPMASGIGVLFLLPALLFACQKSIDEKQPPVLEEKNYSDPQVEQAHAWFNRHMLSGQVNFKGTPNERQVLTKKPLWNEACMALQPDQEVITVPLAYDKDITVGLEADAKFPVSKRSRLLIFKYKGQYRAEVYTYLPAKSYLQGLTERFSGLVIIEDWAGNSLRTYHAVNGKYKRLAKPATQSSGRTAAGSTCYYLNHYICDIDAMGNPENCQFVRSEFLGCEEQAEEELDNYDGSGNGGATNIYEEEVALKKPITWIVDSDPSWYTVKSTEEVSGVKKASEPDGGHFTGIVHKTSFISSGASLGSVWQELNSTVSLDNPRQASTYISGKVTYGPPSSRVTLVISDIRYVVYFLGNF